MTPNERTARTFAEQFTPPLTVCATERINNMPVPDAWSVTYWDDAKRIGITAVAHSGILHAYLECAGPAKNVGTPKGAVRTGESQWHQTSAFAGEAGRVIAKALGLFQEADPQASKSSSI